MASPPPLKRQKIEEDESKWSSIEDTGELSKDAANWKLDRSHWGKASQCYQDLYKLENGADSTTLEFKFPSGVRTKLYFVRKCFDALYKLVHEQAFHDKASLIIGQPGTGKTPALHYLVLRTLTESSKRPLFFITTTTVYLFWQGEVLQRPIHGFPDDAMPVSDIQDLRLLVFTDWESSNWTWEEFKLGLRYESTMRFKDLLDDIKIYASDTSTKAAGHVIAAHDMIQKAVTEAGRSREAERRAKVNITTVPDELDEELNEDDVDTQRSSDAPLDLYYSPEEMQEVCEVRNRLASLTKVSDMDKVLMGDVLLAEALTICGPNMREISQVIHNRRRPVEVDPLVVQVNCRELGKIFLGFPGALNFRLLESSHNFVVATPLPGPSNNEVVRFPSWKITFRTAAIYNMFVNQLRVSQRREQENMYAALQRVTNSAGPMLSALFEFMAPQILSCTGPSSLVRMYNKPHATSYYKMPKTPISHTFTLPRAPVYYCSFEQGKIGDTLSVEYLSPYSTAPSSSGDRYIFSDESNAPLFNGVLVQPSTQNVTLWILQMTTQLSPYQGSSKMFSLIDEMVAGIEKNHGLKVTLRYVLVKPLRHSERVSGEWEMPTGWEGYRGHVFCAHLRVPT
ncbi:hypothetical protein AAF712_004880 [Marasmius tenuissimus]|uniref:Uncharacterized protein n=1 Tax=Marasmius tenuissimus TaxID=585030 RepID=A0ABR3A607_9AGAR